MREGIFTLLRMQRDSELQEEWLMTGKTLSCHKHADSEDVKTHFLTLGVVAHASITFSVALTSISAIDFCASHPKLISMQPKFWNL